MLGNSKVECGVCLKECESLTLAFLLNTNSLYNKEGDWGNIFIVFWSSNSRLAYNWVLWFSNLSMSKYLRKVTGNDLFYSGETEKKRKIWVDFFG